MNEQVPREKPNETSRANENKPDGLKRVLFEKQSTMARAGKRVGGCACVCACGRVRGGLKVCTSGAYTRNTEFLVRHRNAKELTQRIRHRLFFAPRCADDWTGHECEKMCRFSCQRKTEVKDCVCKKTTNSQILESTSTSMSARMRCRRVCVCVCVCGVISLAGCLSKLGTGEKRYWANSCHFLY